MSKESSKEATELLKEAASFIGQDKTIEITHGERITALNDPEKMLVIAVNENEEFDLAYMQSGMSFRDIVVACEMLKAVAMREILQG